MKAAPVPERRAPTTTLPPVAGALESLAVVVPVAERPEDLLGMYAEYAPPLRASGLPFEFIFAFDPRWGAHAAPLVEFAERSGDPNLRVIEVGQPVDEAALLKLGQECSKASIIISLPPYRRVVPEALPAIAARVAAGADLVIARRYPRVDSWVNRAQSRLLHVFIGSIFGGGVHDVRCGVRAMRRSVIEETVIYGDFFRYLPIVAARQGFDVVEMAAPQHPADVRTRVYSPAVYVRRLLDVLALFVLLRFAERPLRFFGTIGLVASLSGAVLLGILFVQRIGGTPLANRPLLLLGAILIVIGIEAIALGLIGELIVYLNARYVGRPRPYRVSEDR